MWQRLNNAAPKEFQTLFDKEVEPHVCCKRGMIDNDNDNDNDDGDGDDDGDNDGDVALDWVCFI